VSADKSVGWPLELWERASGLVVDPSGSEATVPYSTLLLIASLPPGELWAECELKFVGCIRYILEVVDLSVWGHGDLTDWRSTEMFTAAHLALRINAHLVVHIGVPGPCSISGASLLSGATVSDSVSAVRISLQPVDIVQLDGKSMLQVDRKKSGTVGGTVLTWGAARRSLLVRSTWLVKALTCSSVLLGKKL
ncbi:MAG: hypothetical protein P4L87_22435, partial [Formivibrio sp.]|nr:hypothetical protein [Formivibrio sp.]